MSTYEAGQLITHPALAGTWIVTHDQLLPHRHVNVQQGLNSAQITADDAVEVHSDDSLQNFREEVLVEQREWNAKRQTDPNAQQMPEGDILYRGG